MLSSIRCISFPTIFSALSRHAFTTAIPICKWHGATFHLLHVVDLPITSVLPSIHQATLYPYPDMESAAPENVNPMVPSI